MSKKLLNDEEVELLRSNANVERVTSRSIFFSDEFKAKARDEYRNGKSGREIFAESGLSPDVLGMSRITGFFDRLEHKPAADPPEPKTPAAARKLVSRLEKQVLILRQENEFLKKIQKSGAKK